MIEIDYACGTHTGLVRKSNEDAYFADPGLGLWIVADGMGGHQAGEVASGIVISELPSSIERGDSLVEAIEMSHLLIQLASEVGQSSKRMGSTVVALRLEALRYQIAWVGDSRAYLWKGSKLRRLTRDHSYVQMLLDQGLILEAEAQNHPSRNVITQGLGVGSLDGNSVRPDQVEGVLRLGETIILCSDGLTGEIEDWFIADIMARTNDIQERLDRLIDAALNAGGIDNITVILVTPKVA